MLFETLSQSVIDFCADKQQGEKTYRNQGKRNETKAEAEENEKICEKHFLIIKVPRHCGQLKLGNWFTVHN